MNYEEVDADFVKFISKNTTLNDVMKNKGDIYSFVASRLYDLPETECAEWKQGKPYPDGKKRRSEAKMLLCAAYWYSEHANDVLKFAEEVKNQK